MGRFFRKNHPIFASFLEIISPLFRTYIFMLRIYNPLNKIKMKKNNFIEPQIVVGKESRKAAFTEINRGIFLPSVDLIKKEIVKKGFLLGEEVQVMKAEDDAFKNLKLYTINGEEIPPEDRDQYYVIVDGQHRTYAVAQFNYDQSLSGEPQIEVPAKLISLVGDETFAERLISLNSTKRAWRIEDYVNEAHAIMPENNFLKTYQKLIKSVKNPKGYPLSVLNKIYCPLQPISPSDFQSLCSGITEKQRNKKTIIPSVDVSKGDEFIKTALEIGFKQEEITKRYIIDEFNGMIDHYGSRESAIGVLRKLDTNDLEAMREKGKLKEVLVVERFKLLIKNHPIES